MAGVLTDRLGESYTQSLTFVRPTKSEREASSAVGRVREWAADTSDSRRAADRLLRLNRASKCHHLLVPAHAWNGPHIEGLPDILQHSGEAASDDRLPTWEQLIIKTRQT